MRPLAHSVASRSWRTGEGLQGVLEHAGCPSAHERLTLPKVPPYPFWDVLTTGPEGYFLSVIKMIEARITYHSKGAIKNTYFKSDEMMPFVDNTNAVLNHVATAVRPEVTSCANTATANLLTGLGFVSRPSRVLDNH